MFICFFFFFFIHNFFGVESMCIKLCCWSPPPLLPGQPPPPQHHLTHISPLHPSLHRVCGSEQHTKTHNIKNTIILLTYYRNIYEAHIHMGNMPLYIDVSWAEPSAPVSRERAHYKRMTRSVSPSPCVCRFNTRPYRRYEYIILCCWFRIRWWLRTIMLLCFLALPTGWCLSVFAKTGSAGTHAQFHSVVCLFDFFYSSFWKRRNARTRQRLSSCPSSFGPNSRCCSLVTLVYGLLILQMRKSAPRSHPRKNTNDTREIIIYILFNE